MSAWIADGCVIAHRLVGSIGAALLCIGWSGGALSQPKPAEGDAAPAEGDAAPAEVIVITGSRVETTPLDAASDVRVIDTERLERPGTQSIFDAATDVSGISLNVRQAGSGFGDVEVRGLSTNATSGGHALILIDGIPQRRLSFGGPYIGGLPFDSIVRLEVAKGAAAALYGRNALTAAIQLFSDPGSHTSTSTFVTDYELETNTVHASARVGAPLGIGHGEGGTFSLTASTVDSEGWREGTEITKGDVYLHAEIPLSGQDQLSVFGGWFRSRQSSAAPVLLDDDGERLPGIERDANLSVPGLNELNLTEQRAAVRYTRSWMPALTSKLTLSHWAGITDSQVGRPSDRPAEGTVTRRLSRDGLSDEFHDFVELEVLGEYRITEDISGAYSAGASGEWLEFIRTQRSVTTAELLESRGNYGGGIPVDYVTGEGPPASEWRYSDESRRDTTESVYGAFVRKRFSLFDRVTVEGGVRFDTFERTQVLPATGEEASTDGSAISPSVGLNVAAWKGERNRVHLFANWGQAFSPIFRAIANTDFADVDPERSTTLDIGLKTRLLDEMLDLTVTGYQLDRFDIVQFNAETAVPENAGDWRIRGLEFDLRVQVVDGLSVMGAVALRDAEITTDIAAPETEGNRPLGVAETTVTAGADWASSFGLGVGTRLRHVGERFGNDTNTFVLPAYLLWDAHVSYAATDWLTASVFGRNLLDADYFPAAFRGVSGGSGFAGDIRTFGASLRARF